MGKRPKKGATFPKKDNDKNGIRRARFHVVTGSVLHKSDQSGQGVRRRVYEENNFHSNIDTWCLERG